MAKAKNTVAILLSPCPIRAAPGTIKVVSFMFFIPSQLLLRAYPLWNMFKGDKENESDENEIGMEMDAVWMNSLFDPSSLFLLLSFFNDQGNTKEGEREDTTSSRCTSFFSYLSRCLRCLRSLFLAPALSLPRLALSSLPSPVLLLLSEKTQEGIGDKKR